jgi:hypothetical protein
MSWYMYFGGFEHIESICSPQKETMPPPKKALSPVSGAKADKRNARLREKRTANAAPSGGAKSGKRKATTDFAEEGMPVAGGGSSSSAPEFETTKKLCFDLLWDKVNNLESKELGLAAEEAKFYERSLGLQDSYVKLLEWADAEKRQRESKCWKRNVRMC